MSRWPLVSKLRRFLVSAAPIPAIVPILVVTCLGCASFRPVDPAVGPISIDGNEGLVVLHIDTEVAVRSIVISGATAVENLPVGVHMRIVAAPSGTYRWDYIAPLGPGRGIRYTLSAFDDDWRFTVEAGRINYPGLLVLRKGDSTFRRPRLGIYTTNRSGVLLRRLERVYPSLLEQFPMKYSGRGRDEFLERFQAAKNERQAAEATSKGAH